MAKKIAVFSLGLVLALMLAGSVYAITWGEPDGTDHPEVVTLLFKRADGYYSCSGTLMSSTVVMTAGHCTESGGQVNIGTWVRNDPFIDVAGELPLYGGDIEAWLADLWVAGQAIPHPQFNDFAEFPYIYDVGVVLLDEEISLSDYGELPSEGQFNYLRRAKGPIWKRQAVVVGYGRQGAIPAFQQDDWERYRGISAVINTGQSANAGPQIFVFTNNPGEGSGSGGACIGDSGGPAFWVDPDTGEETYTVMAVTSYGITPLCNGIDFQFRTDTAAALDFLDGYIP